MYNKNRSVHIFYNSCIDLHGVFRKMARNSVFFTRPGSHPTGRNQVIRWQKKGSERHPVRTWMIRLGIMLISVAGSYLLLGLLGWLPLETEAVAWNNIRMISGAAILGCLLAAVGYGNE